MTNEPNTTILSSGLASAAAASSASATLACNWQRAAAPCENALCKQRPASSRARRRSWPGASDRSRCRRAPAPRPRILVAQHAEHGQGASARRLRIGGAGSRRGWCRPHARARPAPVRRAACGLCATSRMMRRAARESTWKRPASCTLGQAQAHGLLVDRAAAVGQGLDHGQGTGGVAQLVRAAQAGQGKRHARALRASAAIGPLPAALRQRRDFALRAKSGPRQRNGLRQCAARTPAATPAGPDRRRSPAGRAKDVRLLQADLLARGRRAARCDPDRWW
jgi:hypothetical protein